VASHQTFAFGAVPATLKGFSLIPSAKVSPIAFAARRRVTSSRRFRRAAPTKRWSRPGKCRTDRRASTQQGDVGSTAAWPKEKAPRDARGWRARCEEFRTALLAA
jgi:hypothetical protein